MRYVVEHFEGAQSRNTVNATDPSPPHSSKGSSEFTVAHRFTVVHSLSVLCVHVM